MRQAILLVLLLGACGCAGTQANRSRSVGVLPPPAYTDASASALVFDLPLALSQAPISLPREERQPAAFVGFEESVTTFSYTRMDDQEISRHGDNYLFRQALSAKTAITYR